MSARGGGQATARVPRPPASARGGPGGGRGRKNTPRNNTPRGEVGAALFAEVFGGGDAAARDTPTSVSPPFEEEEEQRGDAEPGKATIGDLMQHMATYVPPPAPVEVQDEESVDPVGAPQVSLSPVVAAVVSRRVLGNAGPIDRERAPTRAVEMALAEAGIPRELEAFPPIEAFDDESFELREASDWMAASPTLAQYLSLETGAIVVRPCQVTGYDADSGAYTVVDSGVGSTVAVARVLLLFDGEELGLFVPRLAAAVAKRAQAVRLLQYRLCVRDMPTTKGDVVLPLDKIDRILQLVFNTDRMKNGSVDSSELLKEVYTDFVQVVNGLIFDYKSTDPEAVASGAFAAVAPPQKPAVEIPQLGQMAIPTHGRLSPDSRQEFAGMSHTALPEAITALTKITGECIELSKFQLFCTEFPTSVKLADFEEAQVEAASELEMALSTTSTTAGSHIRYSLHHVNDAWKSEHEMGFTIMVNKRLQDSLRDLVEARLQGYSDFVDSLCPESVVVNALDDVVVTATEDGRGATEPVPPLLTVQLVLVDVAPEEESEQEEETGAAPEGEGEPEAAAEAEAEAEGEAEEKKERPAKKTVQFDTSTADIQATFLKKYDAVMGVVQQIPEVELPYSRDQAFELRLHNDGQMPTFFLRAPQLEEEQLQDIRAHIESKIAVAMKPLDAFLKLFDPYIPFIQMDVNEFVDNLAKALGESKTLKDLRAEIEYHREQQDMILNTMPTDVRFAGFVDLQCGAIRDFVGRKHGEVAEKIMDALTQDAQSKTDSICDSFEEMLKKVKTPPKSIEEVTEMREYLEELPMLVAEQQDSIDAVTEIKDQLEQCQYGISDEAFGQMYKAIMWPATIAQAGEALKPELDLLQEKFLGVMEGEMLTFGKDLKKIASTVKDFSSHTDITKVQEVSAEAEHIGQQLQDLVAQSKTFKSRAVLFETEAEDYDDLTKVVKDFEPYKALWVTADNWIKKKQEWLDGPFLEVDADDLEAVVNESFKTMFKQARTFSNQNVKGCAEVATNLRNEIDEFKPIVPVAKALRNPGMRERHWAQLSEKVAEANGTEMELIDPADLTLRIATEKHKMETPDVINCVQAAAEVSNKEYAIEKMLDKMLGLWQPMKYSVMAYRSTGTYIIRGTDEINTLLDDHIVATQAMSFSPYKAVFEERIVEWEKHLKLVQDITTEWLNVQKNWMYLQPIFESEDIMRQLPTEGKRFREVDRGYRKMLGDAHKRPNVLDFCKDESLLEFLGKSNDGLEFVQKNLNDYLETKRAAFARFYFLSNDELIEILSQTKDCRAVQPHLKKCFEAISRLEFEKDNRMAGMYSGEKEYVAFAEGLYPEGEVEYWLGDVEKMMQRSVRERMKACILAYDGGIGDIHGGRCKWVYSGEIPEWPGMCVLQTSQVYWTRDLGNKITDEGVPGVQAFFDEAVLQLKDLTALVRTKLSKLGKKTMGALLVMEVHARDVTSKLIKLKVDSQADFNWISQLRYYWFDDEIDTSAGKTIGLVGKMCQCVYPYGYEYLGNSGRLVITPLTDRCYMTLMGAMHLTLGGAPAGPAGTGKTESVKDLAKALAKHCVVFNCSDGLDYLQMAKFFKGLATEGAWACFDEFNRINVEVLSVVAQQILTIQQAIERDQDSVLFEGTTIALNKTFNVFITMNPGYAGRTELPDNLKVLFRPMSMMVPDYAMIAEIRNFSFGFDKSRPLAEKLVATFKLSSEQLSAQSHYDYGMRAVNTVISASGLLKQQFPTMDEDELLYRAVRDSNKPKFLTDDISLFQGIMGDVFSGTKEPIATYPELEAAIEKHAVENKLQCVEAFKIKCIQLYEMTTVRHGMMMVGPTGGGKSSVRTVLQAAITESKGGIQEFDRVRVYAINPKSIKMGQLYGEADLQSGEWTDGIASVMVRHCSNPDTEETTVHEDHVKWIYFDGPVDAIWIENMNTVLDDNKKLCLNSGEIIQLSDTMRIMFEVEDLKHASPATVSRCGMIWVETGHLVPLEDEPASDCPLIKSFLMYLPEPVQPFKAKLTELFDTYLFVMLDFMRRDVPETVTTVDNNLIKSFTNMLNTYFKNFLPQHEDQEVPACNKDTIEPWFLFSLFWSIGGSADEKGRPIFEKKMREVMDKAGCKVGPPSGDDAQVYDFQYDVNDLKWKPWLDTIPSYSIGKGMEFADILVPTLDTVRTSYVLEQLTLKGYHVLCVGETGTSKTVVVHDRLKNGMPDNYDPILMGFSAQTSANQTQDILDGKMDKRRQGRDNNPDNNPTAGTMTMDTGLDFTMWGPPIGKQFIIMVDDFNMPMCEVYDAQPPVEVLRTLVDYYGWYDRKTYRYKNIVDVTLVGAMGPPGGGRNPVTPRMLRHFNFLSMLEMADSSIAGIYNTIMKHTLGSFQAGIVDQAEPAVSATIDIYNRVREELLPTPLKSHYLFNLRDVASVIQGVLQCSPKKVKEPNDVVRIWAHEMSRVFSDRFTDQDDLKYFEGLLKTTVDEKFGVNFHDVVKDEHLVYCDFLVPGTDFENRVYEQASDMSALQKLVVECLEDYNQQFVAMPLILFTDAVKHVTRISRTIRQPLGHALLLGVGGSGRKSLSRLTTAIAEFECFSIEITKSYRLNEWREDLKMLMMKAGKDGKKTVFLFDDTQIVMETFVEDINNILNSGEVPNLMKDEDMGMIADAMTPVCKEKGIACTKLNLFSMFVSRVKANLHLVICMSPVGDSFRSRLRNFPALVNCCTIDWFHPWPEEALTSVAKSQLTVDVGSDETMQAVIKMCGVVHLSVQAKSVQYLEEMSRHNYVTPTSYLALLEAVNILIDKKRGEIQKGIFRLQNGLDKLASTSEQVDGLKEMLTEKKPVLEKTLKEVAEQQVVIDEEKGKAAIIKESAEKTAAAAAIKSAEVKEIADDAQADLDKALPALDNAVKCLKELQKGDIVEVKSMGKPPAGVKLVLHGVCIMFGVKAVKENNPDGGKKIDNWHKAAQPMLANPQKFMDSLIDFDKDSIPESVIDKIQPLINNEDFTPEKISTVSKACTAVCTWVHAMNTYYFIARDVEPKRQKLASAQAELDESNAALKLAQDELQEVTDKLAQLEEDFKKAVQTKMDLEEEVGQCTAKLERADKLLGGLGGEAVRWKESVEQLKTDAVNVVGDVMVAAGTISYLGPFMQVYRTQIEEEWSEKLTKLEIPHTPGVNIKATLMDAVLVRQWNIDGLPSDDFSISNGIIMDNSSRWPLMIDPQGQANKWIKKKEASNNLVVLKATTATTTVMQRSLENCIQFGRPLLVEGVGETMDPMLEPVLANATFKTSTGEVVIKLGDQTIPFHEDFKFYLTTILPNPHYYPEVSVKVTLLNFTITPGGLEEQLLNATVEEEREDLAELKVRLVSENAANARKIREIEDKILQLLAQSKGDILDDEVLIETLAVSKVTSNEIETAVAEAAKTEQEIDATRELYRPVAFRGSILFFAIADLCKVDPMYQYSLNWFTLLFRNAFGTAKTSDNLQQRLTFLMDTFLLSIYQNVCRSLFAKDKLMFSFNLCIQIRQGAKQIDGVEWRFLLTGPTKAMDEAKPDQPWLTDGVWQALQNMGEIPVFDGFLADFKANIAHYQEYFDSNTPETHPMNGEWDTKLNSLQKMVVLRCIRPDKMVNAMQNYIIEHLDQRFIEPPPFDLGPCYDDSLPTTPLIFVLTVGADPTTALVSFAEQMGMFQGKYDAISLGQGQGPIATALISKGCEAGRWVLLQNCHLAVSFMSELEAIVEGFDPERVNPKFRLWLTSMPSAAFPVSILQNGIKMTNEPPKGLRANLQNSYFGYTQEDMDKTKSPETWRKLLFALCFFHATIQERRKFGPLGWNIRYEFNDSDKRVNVLQLEELIEQNEEVPYKVITTLAGNVNYGGRITDDLDRRTLLTAIQDYINEKALRDDYAYTPSGLYTAPPDGDYDSYVEWINNLPLNAYPEVFGLHENADITCAQNETFGILGTLLMLQPKVSGGGGMSRDEQLTELAQDILKRIPSIINFEQVQRKYPVLYEESMNTVLQQEIIKYNKLLPVINASLKELIKAIKGTVVMSDQLENLGDAMFSNMVPKMWEAAPAHVSIKPLASWLVDLEMRIEFFRDWIDNGIPNVFWISGFYFPQAFITGTQQNYARSIKKAIDEVDFDYVVLNHVYDEGRFDFPGVKEKPEFGCIISGPYLEGCRWNDETGVLDESRPKELFVPMPCVWLKPQVGFVRPIGEHPMYETVDPDVRQVYACPLYKTLLRTGTLSTSGHSTNFVITTILPSDKPQSHWIKRGVALFCALRD